MNSFKNCCSLLLIIIVLSACASARHRKLKKEIGRTLDLTVFDNHFVGIMIYDPLKGDTLFSRNSDNYFTPASNTKIFTLYGALKLLPERIPALEYCLQNDTLYFTGTGDPTQLHPFFKDSTLISFLKGFENHALYLHNFQDEKFGPGWAWEDYDGHYSPERGGLPLYGNVLTIFKAQGLSVTPPYFNDSVVPVSYPHYRHRNTNTFFFDPLQKDTLEIPYITSNDLTRSLMEKASGLHISLVRKLPELQRKTVYGIRSDSVYKRMMQESDNFLAEQLIILSSSILSDTLTSERTREYVLDTLLGDLRQPPRWVDGSGLSRYNLFTPESLVHVLGKMLEEFPKARLFELFPAGGVSGTLAEWYPGNPNPYIYAKTGTLGNNYCVSGYLITKSGKTLIFSFMNNHFRQPVSEVKKAMQHTFEWIRDNY